MTNWDVMKMVLYHTFYNELRIGLKNFLVCVTKAPLSPKANCERMAQIMFDAFNVPAIVTN